MSQVSIRADSDRAVLDRLQASIESVFMGKPATVELLVGAPIETGGAEAPAARALVEVIQAAKAGSKRAEARALLDCARHSIMIPDLYNPSDLVEEARAIAQAEGLMDLLQEAQGLARTEGSR